MAAGLLAGIGSAFGDSTTFSNVVDSDWWSASNWDNGIPTAADDAFIASGPSSVTLNLLSGTGVASSLTLNATSSNPHTVTVGNSTLTVDSGANNVSPLRLHNTSLRIEADGTLNVRSTGSADSRYAQLNNATITIEEGGAMTVGSSSSERAVALYVGADNGMGSGSHAGVINVSGGALSVYSVIALGGVGSDSVGTLNISGNTSSVKGGAFLVGDASGAGAESKVTMSGGALDIADLGYPSGSFDPIYIGKQGDGRFELSGGNVTNNKGLSNIVSRSAADGITGIVDHTGGSWKQGASALNIGTHNSYDNITAQYLLSGNGILDATNMVHNVEINIGSANTTGIAMLSKTGGTLLVDNMNINTSGYLVSGGAQIWQIYGNFMNNSTMNTAFDMTGATLEFKGGRAHALNVAGSDFGTAMTLDDPTGSMDNFALDAISLASGSDTLTLTNLLGGSRGLYINALLLPGDDTDLIGTNIISSDGLNIYYRPDDPRSAYLNGLTYDLSGGGQLIAVPEPSSLALMACAIAGGFWAFTRRACRRSRKAPLRWIG